MNIKINNNSFTRIQTGSGPTYKVSLINDSSKELLKVVDPFQKYITRFLDYVINSKEKDDDFINSALNLNLMAKCLDLSNKN